MVRLHWTYSLRSLAAATLLAASGVLSPSAAAELTIAMQGAQTAVDPHWMTSPRNWTVNHHIFEPMIRRDNASGAPEPWLAASWKRLDDTTWEFYLRKDVKWHDGSPFTADDVVFTYDRAGRVPNAPSPFLGYIKYFETVEARDAHTVRIKTKGPAPALLHDIAYLLIVSKKHGGTATTEDYNAGKAAIGTGAYKLSQFLHNDRTVLVRNPDYWGAKEPWDKVTFKMMPSDASRTAAILTGDVDVIESVPTVEIERLKNDKRVTLYTKPTGRVAYMTADAGEEALASGKLLDLSGQPLKTNPFADKRVRQALKLAVDLEQIVKRIYQGEALATGQYLLPDVFGFNPDLKPWKADPAAARKLLQDAGWADKFRITIGSSAETFQNSVQTAQAIAQAWTRIGIQTDVVSMPYPTFLKMRNERLLPVTLMTRQNSPLIADAFFPVVTHSWGNFKGEDGMGTSNFARYSNPKVDDLIEEAMVTMDDSKREALYREVAKIAVDDSQITPLFLLNEATATKPTLTFIPRFDRAIYAMNIRMKQ